MGSGVRRVQTSSYKIIKSWGYSVQDGDYSQGNYSTLTPINYYEIFKYSPVYRNMIILIIYILQDFVITIVTLYIELISFISWFIAHFYECYVYD